MPERACLNKMADHYTELINNCCSGFASGTDLFEWMAFRCKAMDGEY